MSKLVPHLALQVFLSSVASYLLAPNILSSKQFTLNSFPSLDMEYVMIFNLFA